jgi:uncharacterized protein with FMN-binding domain
MNKFLLSGALVIVSAAYVFWQPFNKPVSPTPVSAPSAAPVTVTSPTPIVAAPAPTSTQAPAPAPKPAGLYADGTYTGPAVNAYYGTVQVEAIVQGGQLADVQFLQYPSDRGTSRALSARAMPVLTQEAIKAQSASVNGVSGASQTSEAFVTSLSAALAKAKN